MNTWNNKADETLVSLYAEGENQAFNVLLIGIRISCTLIFIILYATPR